MSKMLEGDHAAYPMYPDTVYGHVAALEDMPWASKQIPRNCWSGARYLIPTLYLDWVGVSKGGIP